MTNINILQVCYTEGFLHWGKTAYMKHRNTQIQAFLYSRAAVVATLWEVAVHLEVHQSPPGEVSDGGDAPPKHLVSLHHLLHLPVIPEHGGLVDPNGKRLHHLVLEAKLITRELRGRRNTSTLHNYYFILNLKRKIIITIIIIIFKLFFSLLLTYSCWSTGHVVN